MVYRNPKLFLVSAIAHVLLLLIFIIGLEFHAPLAVVENSNKKDIISAVVLGDHAKSKILPKKIIKEVEPPPEKPKLVSKPKPSIDPNVIALKANAKKKELKRLQEDLIAKELLADLKKQKEKQKKLAQKKLKKHFEKTIQEQAEKSLRQQLLDEKIKLTSTESRLSQGQINKYSALIQQAISSNWIIPSQANRKLYSVLRIRLAPGGQVLDVQVVKSSGDPSLDSSARAAVIKSSPLPVPSNPDEFKTFQQFELKVKPENVINNSV